MMDVSSNEGFDFALSADAIRPDLSEAYRRAWQHIAAPGTWLTGMERVAVAAETRRARTCALCAERKEALSPFSVSGRHDSGSVLPPVIIDQIHRITTDASRLAEKWYAGLMAEGHTPERYVEALGVAVITISVDRFHQALGLELPSLPTAAPGEPSLERPANLVEGEAWVPIQEGKAVAALVGSPGPAPYVLRALSLVPAEVEAWQDLAAAQYLSTAQMTNLRSPRALDRSQMELVAGRVSSLNECFY